MPDENPDVWLPPVERVAAESTSARLAKKIAENIKKMVDEKEILSSQNRPVRYKDFLVLVQRRNSFVEELVRACKNAKVNIAGVDKISLLEQIAVQDLLAIGNFILLPSDDLTLATILKSPIWNLNDDDLLELCYNRGAQTLWQQLGANLKFENIYSELKTLLNMADFVRPFEFYSYILNKMHGRKKIISRIGFDAEDGLDEFINLCISFEKEHIPSLQGFVDWIGKDEVEIKRELEQSEIDAVRIMTVHGSKGLQAPIVILPDTVRVKSIKNEAGLLLDEVLYYPLCSSDYEKNCKNIKLKEKESTLEEYHRLLYVALTRAEERLCICGYKKSTAVSDDSWYEICRRNLAKIAQEKGDGELCYEVAQELKVEEKTFSESKSFDMPNFAWLEEDAISEGLLARPLTPSRLDEEELPLISPIGESSKNTYKRGRIIHKLLEFLPDVEDDLRANVIEEFLAKNATDINSAETNRIKAEVLKLFENEKFALLFSKNSKAEVPIMGMVDDKIISGQIDRLVVLNDKVMIVDFKTNRPAAISKENVHKSYTKQLDAYVSLVEKIYPNKNVEAYILWTDTTNLMRLK